MNNYKIGDIIKCMVTSIEGYGFFVSTELWYSGLVHISEIASGYIKDINDYVKIGEIIYCQIIDVNNEERKLKLSIKNINYKSNKKDCLINGNSEFKLLQLSLPLWMNKKLDEIKKTAK